MSHEINQLGTKYALFCGPVALLNCELTRYFYIFRSCTSSLYDEMDASGKLLETVEFEAVN